MSNLFSSFLFFFPSRLLQARFTYLPPSRTFSKRRANISSVNAAPSLSKVNKLFFLLVLLCAVSPGAARCRYVEGCLFIVVFYPGYIIFRQRNYDNVLARQSTRIKHKQVFFLLPSSLERIQLAVALFISSPLPIIFAFLLHYYIVTSLR